MKTFLISLFALCVFVAPALSGDFRDFSGAGPEHKILRDLRLDALNVDFVTRRQIQLYGKSLEASIFFVRTSQTVPFLTGNAPYNNVMKDIYGFYDLSVAEDPTREVHDALIDSIYNSLLSVQKSDGFGLIRDPSSYLVFSGPAKSPELIWIGGKVVQARLRRFTEKRSDIKNDAESFWKEKIRFDLNGTRYRIESKKGAREEFLRLHKEGFFSKKN